MTVKFIWIAVVGQQSECLPIIIDKMNYLFQYVLLFMTDKKYIF